MTFNGLVDLILDMQGWLAHHLNINRLKIKAFESKKEKREGRRKEGRGMGKERGENFNV